MDSMSNSKQELTIGDIELSPRESKRDKILKVVTIILFFAAVVFLILFLVYFFRNGNAGDRKREEICNTFACLRSAAAILLNMDPASDPCENFYDFACGKFNENNPLSASKPSTGPFVTIHLDSLTSLQELLEAQDPTALEPVQKVRTFYKSCMNTQAMDARNTTRLMDMLKAGGANQFPTLDPNWVDENWTLNDILARVPRVPKYPIHGNPYYQESVPLIDMSVLADVKQTDKNIIYFAQTGLPFNDRDLFLSKDRESELQMYKAAYVHFTSALGASTSVATQDAQDVVQLEILIANATIPQTELLAQMEKFYKKMTIGELAQRYPGFDWLEHVRLQFSIVDMDVTAEEEVVIIGLDSFDEYFALINRTSRRTLLNYCMWKAVWAYQDFVGKPLPNAISDVQKLKGTARNHVCIAYADMFFFDITGRLYVDKYFSAEKRIKVENMIADLKDAFKEIVRESDWMSEQTKQAALTKVDAIREKIGYSDMVKNDTYLNEKTNGIMVEETEVFNNVLNITGHMHRTNLRSLRESKDKMAWPVSAATVNAYYNPLTNSIIFPAAILQKPVYNAEYLEVLMYGGLGFFIGHEITHGFDITGSDFDKDGNLRMWWRPDDLQHFESRADCLAKQYSSYVYPGVNMSLDGRLTLRENIADNGALKEAYKAYKKLVAKEGQKNPKLPVLPYSPDQLFFIATAQIWCQNIPNSVVPLLLRQSHPLNRFRAFAPMRNSVEFARAFKCPEGSYMNPQNKCHVW